MKGELHIARSDVLLWALGGFGPPQVDAPYARGYPQWVIREIVRLAALPKTPLGEAASLAERAHRPKAAIRILIMRARRGEVPQYWDGHAGPPGHAESARSPMRAR